MDILTYATTVMTAKNILTDGQETLDDLTEKTTEATTAITTVQEVLDSIPEDYTSLSDDVEELQDAFTIEQISPINWLDPNGIETGCYYWTDGKHDSTSYNSTGLIPVEAGKTYYFTRGQQTVTEGRSYFEMRFLVGYGSDGTTVKDSAQNVSGETGYTVPNDVAFVRMSNGTYINASTNPYTMIQTPSALVDFEAYFDPYKKYTLKANANNKPYIDNVIGARRTSGVVYEFDINSDDFTSTTKAQDSNNYVLEFRGNITTFNGLIVAHGYQGYMTGYVKVTPTDFEYYMGTEASPRVSEAHGLTIKDYINIKIESLLTENNAIFTITTNGGQYTKTSAWDVRDGILGVKHVGTNVLTDCRLSYYPKGWNKDIHIYGDSYVGLYADKWTYYLIHGGYTNYNLNAYPGRASAEALVVLKQNLQYATPKKILWLLGMNNGDSGAINTAWKSAVDELMEICAEKGIELILATIPNVPTVDNTYKNAYVIASGYRYIDFASSVGALNDSTWFDGLLSNDGVHPSNQGAIALYCQAIADVPELMSED